MQLVRELGRRGFVGLAGLLALGRSAQPSGTRRIERAGSVRVLAGAPDAEPGPVAAEVIRRVRDSLTAPLLRRRQEPLHICVHGHLESLFPDRVTISALPPAWTWVWRDDHWELVCYDPYSFAIRVAPRLVVLVGVEDVTPMG